MFVCERFRVQIIAWTISLLVIRWFSALRWQRRPQQWRLFTIFTPYQYSSLTNSLQSFFWFRLEKKTNSRKTKYFHKFQDFEAWTENFTKTWIIKRHQVEGDKFFENILVKNLWEILVFWVHKNGGLMFFINFSFINYKNFQFSTKSTQPHFKIAL